MRPSFLRASSRRGSRGFLPFAFGLALLLAGAPGRGAPPDSAGSAPLRLAAARPTFRTAPGDRRVVPRIPGFGLTGRPGEPMLPVKALLVAIPEGVIPELLLRSAPFEPISDLDIAPAPRHRSEDHPPDMDDPGRGRTVLEYDADERLSSRDAEIPEAPLRLGRIGYLRQQRFVEVLYSPLTYHAGKHRGRYYPAIEAEVVFRLPPGAARAEGRRAPSPDPLFEGIYRSSLVNYEQGRGFRVPPGERLAGEPSGALDAQQAGLSVTLSDTTASITPGTGRYKVTVSRPGIYRLDYNYLNIHAPDLLGVDPRTLVLRAEGVEVPIRIRDAAGLPGEDDRNFGTGDALEFCGRPKTELEAVPNVRYSDPLLDILQANDFTDTQVYWLTSEEPAGSHRRLTASIDATPGAGLPLAADFEERAVWDENTLYLPLGDDSNPFFSLVSLLANSTAAQRDLVLALPGLTPATGQAFVRLRLRGGSSSSAPGDDHLTRAWVNGDTAGGKDFPWDGETIHEEEFAISHSVLTDPSTIHLRALGAAGVSVDRQYIDTVSVRYRRRFLATGDLLVFTYPNQNARFQVGGFSGAGATIYEVGRDLAGTREADPILVRGAEASGPAGSTTYTFEVRQEATAPALRTYVVAGPCVLTGPCRLTEPDGMVRADDPVLHDPANRADYLVIAARGTIDTSSGGSLAALLAHRRATQGLEGMVVYVDQIYDEFSFGLRDPNAIRAFLAYAFENWRGPGADAPPPTFVLLVGDATPDYKNTLGRSDWWVDQVPTPIMLQRSSIIAYYSSDNWIASFRGDDQLPDVALGRISTRTADAATAVFDKILLYETAPPPGAWKGRALLVASDGNNTTETQQFESALDLVATSHFATAPYSTPNPPLYYARPPWNASDPARFKSDLIAAIDGGAAILYYIGHGAFDVWGRAAPPLFKTQDAIDLANAGGLPFMINVNCLSGGFHYLLPAGSVGEGMTNNPRGGAIATLAPSTLSNAFVGQDVAGEVFPTLFGPGRERLLGLAATDLRVKMWAENRVMDLQGLTFLGDPATVLATPAPPPPTGLQASAGNGVVSLAWTAPPTPVASVRIYRAANRSDGLYAPVACETSGATSCIDRSVINATTYYYAAASLDAEGFEGRWSNFNTDCAAGGPDCVSATPINDAPPAVPTGLQARDPGTGGRLDVSWNASPEKDLKNYILKVGTLQGGPYATRLVLAPTLTATTLNGLSDATRYYMTLSASNTSGLESASSPEVSEVPHLIQGIAPPRSITDLTVLRSGADIVLSWSRPVVDVYGRPTTVVGYRLYRGETPGFAPFASAPWMTLNDGATTTIRDTGAYDLPKNFYYLVAAIDANGLVSGVGRELPNGIGSLAVSLAAPGTVRLSWPAVTTDLQGFATLIDHYQVHQSNRPVARATLGPATLVRDNVRTLSVDLTVDSSPGSAPAYFSVIAVDDRGNLSPF